MSTLLWCVSLGQYLACLVNGGLSPLSHIDHCIYISRQSAEDQPISNLADEASDPHQSRVLLCFTMWLCDLCLWFDLKALLLFTFAILLVVYFLSKKEPPNFPPGPPALPLLGNVFNIESKQPHIYLTKVRWQTRVFILCSGVSVILKIIGKLEFFSKNSLTVECRTDGSSNRGISQKKSYETLFQQDVKMFIFENNVENLLIDLVWQELLSWNMQPIRVTCWTTDDLFSALASTACWWLWECVLHTSGKTQNSVCVWLEDGEGSLSDTGWQLCGPALQPDGDQDLFRELRWITQTYRTSTSVLK